MPGMWDINGWPFSSRVSYRRMAKNDDDDGELGVAPFISFFF